MKNIITTLSILSLSACATSAPTLSQEQLRHNDQRNVNLSKTEIYDSALDFVIENSGDSNVTIKRRNEARGEITTKNFSRCNVFRQFGDPAEYFVDFTLKLKATEGKLELRYSNISMADSFVKPVLWSYQKITNESKLKKVQNECLKPLSDRIFNFVEGEKNGK